MDLNFKVVDIKQSEDKQSFDLTAIILDDPRYLGYIFIFRGVSLSPHSEGIGVSYDLVIDLQKDTVLQQREVDELRVVGHSIIEKVMTDFVDTTLSEIDGLESTPSL